MKKVLNHTCWWPFVISLGILGGLFFWQYTALLETTGGIFSYVLDDAYIHLALSENLMQGHYGVNLQEHSAPSSSILWSFLMAPVAQWQLAPLVFNISLSALALFIWHTQVQRFFPGREFGILVLGFNISFIAFANLVGVSFTGMENLLQMVIALGICVGAFKLIEGSPPAKWFLALIIIAPLARYETITLSGLGLSVLFFRGHMRLAIVSCVLMLVPLVAFSLYLNSLGLGYLPSSISAKSTAMQASAVVSTLLNLYNNLYESTGSLMLALLIPVAWRGLTAWKSNPLLTLIAVMVAGIVIAHLALARLGNWGRYEIYVWITLLFTLVYLFQEPIRNWYQSPTFPKAFAYIALAFFTVIGAKRSIVTSISNPIGGANIALQQYQMHLFATQYWQKPVAVNDLGWVAYQNDHYVLDVWGLANTQALEMRKNNTPGFLNTLAQQHDVELAMIYSEWFAPSLLSQWILVGELHLPDDLRRMTSAVSRVQFYATVPSAAADIKAKMRAFESKLPKGAYMSFP